MAASKHRARAPGKTSPPAPKRQAAEPATRESIAHAFEGWRAAFRRDAWKPVAGSTRPALFVNSRFGGPAMIGAGETWPICGECRSPLDQLVQLKLSDLPSAHSTPKGEGVVQLFRCSAADCDADDHEPFSASHLVRLVPEQALFGGLGAANRPPPLPQREIRGWERFDDHPSSAEHERCGITYERVFEPGVTITSVRWVKGDVAIEGIREPNSGGGILEGSISPACAAFDKLGGWPAWSQGVEYPSCPKCDAEMQSVFQLASRDNLPIELGDLGVGHITQCPKHPSVLAFSWAC